jgi:uncharacterized protein (TIGR02246 family)
MDTLSTLLAFEEIRQLKARYSQTMDKKEWEAYGMVFTEDAVMEMGTVRAEGRAGIVKFVSDALGDVTTSHNSHSPIIELTSDTTAKGTWSTTYVQEGDRLTGWGFYNETYRKENGQWLIASTYLVTTMFKGTDIPEEALIEK